MRQPRSPPIPACDDAPSSGFEVTDLRSQVRRLDACDDALTVIAADVVDLATQLRRLQEHAGGLERLQPRTRCSLRRELQLADAVATARRDADRSSRALEDMTARTGERDAQTRLSNAKSTPCGPRSSRGTASWPRFRQGSNSFGARRGLRRNDGAARRRGVRFVAFPEGYRLAVSGEPCARAGDVVQIDGRAFRVDRIGRGRCPRTIVRVHFSRWRRLP